MFGVKYDLQNIIHHYIYKADLCPCELQSSFKGIFHVELNEFDALNFYVISHEGIFVHFDSYRVISTKPSHLVIHFDEI